MSLELNVNLAEYPHLNITEADLQRLFEQDPVLRDDLVRIEEFERKIASYDSKLGECDVEIARVDDERSSLEAKLRQLDTFMREMKGMKRSYKYHITLAKQRIVQRLAKIEQRKKFLYKKEVNARLSQIGRELKLNVGRRVPTIRGSAVLKDPPSGTMGTQQAPTPGEVPAGS